MPVGPVRAAELRPSLGPPRPRDRSGGLGWVFVRRLQLLYLAYGAVVAVVGPFIGPVLQTRGLDPAAIGLVGALGGIAFALSVPVWGHVADVVLGRPRALQVAALGSVLAIAAFGAPLPVEVAVLAIVAYNLTQSSFMPLSDAIAMNAYQGTTARTYGRLRLFASLMFAISIVSSGILYDHAGYAPAYALYAIVAVIMMVVLVGVPDAPRAVLSSYLPHGHTAAATGPDVHARTHRGPGRSRWQQALGSSGVALATQPRLWGVLAAIVVVNLAVVGSWTFLPLRLVDLGATPSMVALATGMGALCEVPAMLVAHRVSPRVGLRGLFGLGSLLYAAGFVAWMSLDEPLLIVAFRGVAGFGFAWITMACVLTMPVILPAPLQATGQALYQTGAYGLAATIANLGGGLLVTAYGYPALFALGAGVSFVAVVLGWRVLPARAERARDDAAAMEPAPAPAVPMGQPPDPLDASLPGPSTGAHAAR